MDRRTSAVSVPIAASIGVDDNGVEGKPVPTSSLLHAGVVEGVKAGVVLPSGDLDPSLTASICNALNAASASTGVSSRSSCVKSRFDGSERRGMYIAAVMFSVRGKERRQER